MIKWLCYLVFAEFFTLLCYLTNPLVVLFADEYGELNGWLHYWQTWDDSCDSEFFMKNVCPTWLDYGYDAHYTPYRDTDEWLAPYGKTRQFSVLKPGATWTTKERIQRYFCRLLWLLRNNGYGFAMFLFGEDMTHIKWHIQEADHYFGSVGSWLTEPFVYKDERRICSWLKAKIYIGWKTYPGNGEPSLCMISDRIWFDFGKENE